MTTAERLTAVAENVQKVYEAGKAAGGLPDGDMTDPNYVYAVTRPKDWLPMPTPGDNEIYLLGQIPQGKKGYFSAAITFAGACLVEFGTVKDGVFLPKESYSPSTGVGFTYVLDSANYEDELADGYKQYMARISGQTFYNIDFRFLPNTYGNVPQAEIVDIACGAPCGQFSVGTYNAAKATLQRLRYINFVGKGGPSWINGDIFAGNCKSLLSIGCEKNLASSWAGYALYLSDSLMAVSPKLFAGVVAGIDYAFLNTRITGININNIQPTSCNYSFQQSSLNKYTPETVDLSKSTSFNFTFNQCRALISVTGLDISSAKSMSGTFAVCESLNRLTFAGETTPGGFTISLTDTRLDHDALVEMIASLPTATAAATITITGNPGASELTDAEIAVATAKNWTITR